MDILSTTVGDFEIDWWFDPREGTISIGIDADDGRADCPDILEVASAAEVAEALEHVGLPRGEAASLAPGLWETGREFRRRSSSSAGD